MKILLIQDVMKYKKIVFYNNGYKNSHHNIEYFGENINLKQLIDNLK